MKTLVALLLLLVVAGTAGAQTTPCRIVEEGYNDEGRPWARYDCRKPEPAWFITCDGSLRFKQARATGCRVQPIETVIGFTESGYGHVFPGTVSIGSTVEAHYAGKWHCVKRFRIPGWEHATDNKPKQKDVDRMRQKALDWMDRNCR